MGFFDKIKEGLRKTKEATQNGLNAVFASFRSVDEDFLEELCDALILADIGANLASDVTDELKQYAKLNAIKDQSAMIQAVCSILNDKMVPNTGLDLSSKPSVILVVGVNGVGKTTTIGKLSEKFAKQGKSVLLAAADTFRAAAAEQLSVWSKRTGADIVRHGEGADPSAVIFDAISAAKARGSDVILVDTAGRLHNKQNLMNELAKMNRIIDRELPGASKEILLVLDATTGQNAISQAESFNEVANLTGIVLTKLDGTAKGGIVINISSRLGVPVKFVGVGEKAEDLLEFDPRQFVQAFFE